MVARVLGAGGRERRGNRRAQGIFRAVSVYGRLVYRAEAAARNEAGGRGLVLETLWLEVK